ncbi:MAG: type II secretion system F family protein [Candidatus Omnitrophica bacterium]|nr:type II secretion system F family protein [Candidatus Omnitrophota bacterium]
MLIAILASIFVFICVFYLANAFYPSVEKQTIFLHKKKIDKMSPKLDQMFLDISAEKLVFLDIAAPVLGGFLGYMLTEKTLFAVVGGVLGLIFPVIFIKILEKKRRKKFASQLVDAIMILCSSLRVGMSLQQAFEVLVEEIATPMSQEFNLVLRQMRMGFSLEAALSDLKKRMKLDDLEMVITSLLIAKETGGDITDTLTKVVSTIQERNKLLGKVKSLTIQAKMQGFIMSVIPIFFAFFVYQSDKHYFDIFFQDNMGKAIFSYAIVSQIIGAYLIIKLSKVDV